MNAVSIKIQINIQEKRLSSFQNDLAGYEKALERIIIAKTALEQKQKQYENEFRNANSSYPAKIMAIDSLGLIGVEKIQEGIRDAYSGNREKIFAANVENTLSGIQRKKNREEEKISKCKRNITSAKNAIESLKKQYAMTLSGN